MNKSDTKYSIFDNIIMDIFLFIATILSIITTAAIIHLICKHTKLKTLLTGIALQPVKQLRGNIWSWKRTTKLYHAMVYNNSVNFNDFRSYNLYFCNYTKVLYFQKKAVFKYSYCDVILFRH